MRGCFHVLSCLALAGTAAVQLEAQAFSLEHYAKVARVSALQVAPDGNRAALVVAWPDYDSNVWEAEVVEVDLRSRLMRTLTQRMSASSPRWSPSGDRLAFLASVEGKSQLFILPGGGGDARQVTHSPTGVGTFAWRPDGAALAFVASSPPPPGSRYDDAFEINGNDYLTRAAPRANHLYSIASDGGEATQLAGGEWSIPGLFSTIAWSADGRQLYFTRQESAGTREWERRELVSVLKL